jgi:hypothetical protein
MYIPSGTVKEAPPTTILKRELLFLSSLTGEWIPDIWMVAENLPIQGSDLR